MSPFLQIYKYRTMRIEIMLEIQDTKFCEALKFHIKFVFVVTCYT